MENLQGKKVFITGGTRGIGFATAKQFIENGAEVLISGRSERVFDAAARLGEHAKGIVWDMRYPLNSKKMFV